MKVNKRKRGYSHTTEPTKKGSVAAIRASMPTSDKRRQEADKKKAI